MKSPLILGLDIGGTKTAVISGTFSGEILDKIIFPTETEKGFKHSFNNICKNIKNYIADKKKSGEEYTCISISIGGPLNIEKGIIYSPPNLPYWDKIPLKRLLEKRFKLPVYVEHDGNAGALAEFYFGAGSGYKNVVFLTMGTGMGAGLILNGKIYRGSTDTAGEVGHVRLAEDGPLSYGKKGCFESFCSGNGISKLARIHFPEKYKKNATAKDVIEDMKNGDKDAEKVISISAKYLGRGLAMIVDTLNPDVVVIGSLAVRMGDKLLQPAIKEMKKESLTQPGSICRVVPSKLGEKIGDIASLCAAIDRHKTG
jgi:glucokinase